MPPRYPPIAPRAPTSTAPSVTRPSENVPQELRDTGTLDRLRELEAEPARFADAHHPMRDAVAIALLKPAGELLKRHAQRQRMAAQAIHAPADSDDPTERPMPLEADDGTPAILAIAEAQVAQAVLGDVKAFANISDRIEGKAGLRKADMDAETEAQRRVMRATIEELVRGMGDRRARDDGTLIDVTPREDDA